MKPVKDWYWKTDEEVGLGKASRRQRHIKVWLVLSIVLLTAVILGAWLLMEGVFDFFRHIEGEVFQIRG
ncbi:hypothetical protein [Paenibacillus pedocola]|uniref:hypothetical protein n=1 Tax=Paenibacillus pedocola TaxID=3242193 RepID=UPI002877F95B|nr:hypothetical protein [Paenibacillus typhae]